MSKPIRQLPTTVANQIAAGEVVERPASVIKELIENSLDAGATTIEIELLAAGLGQMTVTDNGSGIDSDNLANAIIRHATSKIYTMDDLVAINSLGFRGEALASIASVSQFSLASRVNADGFAIEVGTDGKVSSLKPVAMQQGTKVSVRNLFYNVPARRKFLKTEVAELRRIKEVVHRFVLSHWNIGFRLKNNQKLVCDFAPCETELQQQQRIRQILGNQFIEHAIAIKEQAANGMKLAGWISMPTLSRNQPDMQFCFINGRVIIDKVINHAIRQAYRDVLFGKLHPYYVLYLTINPEQIDVNVHPTKHEVRFHQSQVVHQFIFKSVQQALADTKPSSNNLVNRGNVTLQTMQMHSNQANGNQHQPAYNPREGQLRHRQEKSDSLVQFQHNNADQLNANLAHYQASATTQQSAASQPKDSPIDPMPPLGYAIGQVNQLFILSDSGRGLVIVDTHAAHERIIFEKLKKAWANQGDKARYHSQQLALPIDLQVSDHQLTAFEDNMEKIAQLGFAIDQVGANLISVKSAPIIIPTKEIEPLILQTLDNFVHFDNSEDVDATIDSILGNMACRSAIRGQTKLTIDDMNAILREIEMTSRSNQCNHGRPTYVHLDMKQLNSLFLRGQ